MLSGMFQDIVWCENSQRKAFLIVCDSCQFLSSRVGLNYPGNHEDEKEAALANPVCKVGEALQNSTVKNVGARNPVQEYEISSWYFGADGGTEAISSRK